MIKAWAAAKLGVPVERIESVRFEHEDAWCSDAGTWWPEENTAHATVTFEGAQGQVHRRDSIVPGTGGGAEDLPELLQEILDANRGAP